MTRFTATLLAIGCLAGCTANPTAGGTMTPTTFKLRVENTSTATTLMPSDGSKAPAPNSPIAWVVHASGQPIFTDNQPDRGQGLEKLAEDGDPSALGESLKTAATMSASGVVAIPVGDQAAGPATPGKAFEVTFMAKPGDHLSFASMFGQSNDVFLAPDANGIALFQADGKPVTGDVTSQVKLWDAGTEMNQEPGIGADQAPRQKAPNTGAADPDKRVRMVSDGFTYPAVANVVRVTLTPQP